MFVVSTTTVLLVEEKTQRMAQDPRGPAKDPQYAALRVTCSPARVALGFYSMKTISLGRSMRAVALHDVESTSHAEQTHYETQKGHRTPTVRYFHGNAYFIRRLVLSCHTHMASLSLPLLYPDAYTLRVLRSVYKVFLVFSIKLYVSSHGHCREGGTRRVCVKRGV